MATIVSASLNTCIHDVYGLISSRVPSVSGAPSSSFSRNATSFVRGSPLMTRSSSSQSKPVNRSRSVTVRSEQSTGGGNGLDVWLGRLAMIGFAAAVTVEVSTGKGLLENFGLTGPLPTVALGVTALVGILTAVFIFQSASKE